MAISPIDLVKLRDLMGKCSPGLWDVVYPDPEGDCPSIPRVIVSETQIQSDWRLWTVFTGTSEHPEDCELIALLKRLVPEMIAICERSQFQSHEDGEGSMGTLFEQPNRNYHQKDLDNFLANATELSKKHGATVADVIAAKAVIERERRNDLLAADGDVRDEQLKGFGEILRDLAAAIEGLKDSD